MVVNYQDTESTRVHVFISFVTQAVIISIDSIGLIYNVILAKTGL